MAGMVSSVQLTRFVAVLLICVLWLLPTQSRAQSLIRDAEIERSLKELAAPLISAAGLSPSRIKIMVINDSSLNAFVIDSQHVFIHSGLIMRMERPAELQAVIAHELAHIANGHLTQRALNLGSARTAGMMGLLLSAAAAAAGAPDAAAGIALGTQSSALRVFLKHTRAEEASADQSALRFMVAAGVDPNAMVDVLNIFRGQEALSAGRRDPWASSHPLTSDRLRAVRGYAAGAKPREGEDASAAYWFGRMQAKMQGFLRNPNSVLRRVKKNDTSEAGLLAKSVAYHRLPNQKLAYANIDALIAKRPNDPYYRELKGQILLENGNAAAAAQAYGQAVNLAPNQPLILAGYGRALLAQDTAEGNRKALQVLEQARGRDSQDPRMLRDLAVAYARAGNNGQASLATAERYALVGRLKDAGVHANRAAGQLPRGSSGWNRAQDVIRASELAETAKRN